MIAFTASRASETGSINTNPGAASAACGTVPRVSDPTASK
jgi:hypothetical protein